MYTSIANNSFSYLLTIDEFRNALPDELRPSWIKITTITMISNFIQKIDIKRLRSIFEDIGTYRMKRCSPGLETSNGFEWKLKPTTFYNQVTLTYHDSYSTKSVKVFPNGSIQVAGCCDIFDCKRIITQLVYIFKTFLNLDVTIPLDSFRIVMINSNFSLNHNVNLIKVTNWFERYSDIFKVSFEPDRYSAVKIKFKPAHDMKEITCSIFSTGKIIITGAETLKEIAFAYNIINQHINENDEIRVSRTDETDVFDIFLGYRCDPFVKHLKEKGFESWVKTITNRQINF
jgi:TATA-box binding protein (TBP) (component of TFIID and TFIIIB)|tara:strand:+ start:3463 stop:4326 length:864 start_codon:yes stop_codon:yes gene_type:complete